MTQMAQMKDPRTFAVIGAAMEVHRQLGPGFLEAVYQEALSVELKLRNIPHEREVVLPIHYKGQKLECSYRADFVCYGSVLLELKALDGLGPVEESQIINYLKITRLEVGMLLNFGAPRLEYRRFVGSVPSVSSVDSSSL